MPVWIDYISDMEDDRVYCEACDTFAEDCGCYYCDNGHDVEDCDCND